MLSRKRDAVLIGTNISSREAFEESRALASAIHDGCLDVLRTIVPWPRDQLHLREDGSFVYVPDIVNEAVNYDHEAYHGGKILVGDGFIIASDSVLQHRRKRTLEELSADEGHYYSMLQPMKVFRKEGVVGNPSFYIDSVFRHIDRFFNIAGRKKKVFTYDNPLLMEMGKDMERKTGYDLVLLPQSEAQYAAVGFIEVGDKVVVDRRAHKSMDILKEQGYRIIQAPPMIMTNRKGGSIRCLTRELPVGGKDYLDGLASSSGLFSKGYGV